MPVTVVVGGQFGSEGKGKVAHYLAQSKRARVAIRIGGSNSGHTVVDSVGGVHVFRVLPTAAILGDTVCVLGAGTYIDVEVLRSEIDRIGITADRLMIDPNAYVVGERHKAEEASWQLGARIGSTQSGTGAAVVERARRLSADSLAKSDNRLTPFVRPVQAFLREQLRRGERIILEGTQGFGLSVLHSPYYPKATSRDTTAGTFIAEAGLSPLDVDDIVLVIRAFPIRVAGESGYLPNEIDWDTISRDSGLGYSLVEYTSVTRKIRRVAQFDSQIVRAAISANAPTTIVLNHLDYVDAKCAESHLLSAKAELFVKGIERELDAPINYLGTGPRSLFARHKNVSFAKEYT